MTKQGTLTIRLGDGENETEQLLTDSNAMERGEQVDESYVLVLDDAHDLHRLLSPANLGLLRAIREHEPDSIRAAASLVDRDYKEVHRNMTELEALNVVKFEQDGRSKRPVVRFDEIDIEVSLQDPETDAAPA